MKKGNPRHGSMQYWPRKRAKRTQARVRAHTPVDSKLSGFAGYKVGMTHLFAVEGNKNSKMKGKEVLIPATIIECPPLKAASIRFYQHTPYGLRLLGEVLADKQDKELARRLTPAKKVSKKIEDFTEFDEVRINVHTQPKLTGIGKKKPEVFELAIGGSKEDQLAYAKEKLGQEIPVTDVIAAGEQVDIHAVTKGKGFQGPVKRFGVSLRAKKSEKVKRGPGSLGGWKAQGHVMYRVAYAGQTGYHQRTEHNKWVLKIAEPSEVVPKGDFPHYGVPKNPVLIVKGSIAGPKKRLIKLMHASRKNPKITTAAPNITYISQESTQ